MKTFLRDNGLTITLVGMFLFSALGMMWSGLSAFNEDLRDHGLATVSLLTYLASGQNSVHGPLGDYSQLTNLSSR